MGQRRKKRYGPVQNRGVYVPAWASERCNRAETKKLFYVIPAGTVCHVRKRGGSLWTFYRTKVGVICHHYLWRNETHYGFAQGEWELKVPVGSFTVKS